MSNYKKERQFQSLSSYSNAISHVTSIRDGRRVQIHSSQILVGDVLVLSAGDIIHADGILIEARGLLLDESSLTGESDSILKSLESDPFILSGPKVVNGDGLFLGTCVGIRSLQGKTLQTLSLETGSTPLQSKLSKLIDFMSIYGSLAVIITIIALLIAYFTVKPVSWRKKEEIADDIIGVFVIAVTLIVIAVPEGLPMAITLTQVCYFSD